MPLGESKSNPDRLLGIETEVVMPIIGRGTNREVQELLAQVLTNHGIASCVRAYSQTAVPDGYDLAIEHDSSLRDESRYRGISWAQLEIKTKPLTVPQMQQILPSTLEIIRYMGARVNASCGLHVHHHLSEVLERPEIVRNLMHLYWRFHPVIYGLVAPSRLTNTYCRPPRPDEATLFDTCRTYDALCRKLAVTDRRCGLNLTNLVAGGRLTVEWRMHQGSTDHTKICSWVLLTQRLLEHSIRRSCHYRPQPIPNTEKGLNAMLMTIGLKANSRIYPVVDKELREVARYLVRRWRHLNQPGGYPDD